MFKLLQRLLNAIRPQPQLPSIYSYGDSHSGLSAAEMQPLMEWLMASLLAAGYQGTAHLCLYDNHNPYPGIEARALEGLKHQQPVFGYRTGDRIFPAPQHYSWRVIAEHPTLRFYQLEAQD